MTLPAILVREAVAADAPAITELYRYLVEDARISVLANRINHIVSDRNSVLLVAERGSMVHGTAFVGLCADPMYGSQAFAVVENVVVRAAMQRQGIGRALLRHVEKHCWEANCSKIMLLSAAGRTQAHAFFEAAGFSSSKKRAFVRYRSEANRNESRVLAQQRMQPPGSAGG